MSLNIQGELYINIFWQKIMIECKHWACNLKNNTCIGCGAVICSICLKEHLIVNMKIKIIAVKYQIKINNINYRKHSKKSKISY
jgi:hypothetical protein